MIQLPRSTFYYSAQQSAPNLSDEQIVEQIEAIQDELSGYGYRRVTRALRVRGYDINHKRVARLMRQQGLGIKPKRRFVRTTDSQHNWPVCPNLYRNRIPDQPDQIWVADITYIRIEAGFVYLAVILDACSRKVVGYAIGRQIDTQLTLAALKAAVLQRRPKPGACIHHSDSKNIGTRCSWAA
jgi:putative transposase